MLKKVVKGITVVVFILITINYSYAADGWQGPMKVLSVVAHKDCYIIDTDASLADCGISGRFTVKIDAMMAGDLYKMAMMAFLANKYVYIYVDASQGCLTSGMVSNRMIIY